MMSILKKLWSKLKIYLEIPPIIVFGIVATGLALLLYGYLGLSSRYYADDYCMSGMVFQMGFWDAQVAQYIGWSNRFSGMLLLSISELFGQWFIRVWTGLTLLFWVVALTWTIAQICRFFQFEFSTWISLLFAEWIIFFTVLLAPQIYQSLYWRIGIITYTIPLISMSYLPGLIFHNSRKKTTWLRLAAVAGLAFLSGGFSETYVTIQTSLLILALVSVPILVKNESRKSWQHYIGTALVGSLLALLVVLISPGNAVRNALMPPPPGLVDFSRLVVSNAFIFMYGNIQDNSFQAFLALVGPMLVVYGVYAQRGRILKMQPSPLIMALFASPIIAYLSIAASMAPAAYAQSSYPDGRVLINAGFILTLMLVVSGIILGIILSQLHQWAGEPPPGYLRLLTTVLLLIVLLYPIYDSRKVYYQLPAYREHAALWDQQDDHIRAARNSGQTEIELPALIAPGNLANLDSDPGNWVNVCMAQFYDVRSVRINIP